ncbi:MAG: hypothetical protein QN122_07655, partial [Armatimonadota bacterium]|nr:hypothetical protein [Armatimonadota bacterium]
MQRERLLQPFGQAPRRAGVDPLQVPLESHQLRLRLRIGRLLVRPLQFGPPGCLLALGQIGHHVLSLMPLAPLDLGRCPEDLLHRGPQPLAAVDDHQQALVSPQAAGHQLSQEGRADQTVLSRRLHKPQHH